MSVRGLAVVLALCAFGLWLMTTPVGAMVGFFAGIAVAFFVAPILLLLHVPEAGFNAGLWALGIGYGGFVLYLLARGGLDWWRARRHGARGWWAAAAMVGSLPLGLWWSFEALKAAWP